MRLFSKRAGNRQKCKKLDLLADQMFVYLLSILLEKTGYIFEMLDITKFKLFIYT